jgi:UDP-N-acetylglucosamine 4-epimerase
MKDIGKTQRTWLVTGCAGFIGSNLIESLLRMGQRVVGLDNFATGFQHNLDQVEAAVGARAWGNFRFIRGDIRSLETCHEACSGVDIVLHEAALGSVPRSIDDPITSHETNVTGFLNMLVAARDAKVKRFVYAASSAAYGDWPGLPKVEETIGRPLSPYGAGKYMNELYADVFGRCYGLETIGLRYFNVFGPRQDPESMYSAVIPKFMEQAYLGVPLDVHSDGRQSRDFTYVANVVSANLLAAKASKASSGQVMNIANSETYSLLDVIAGIERFTGRKVQRKHHPARGGDVRRTWADNRKIRKVLGYKPVVGFDEGLRKTWDYFVEDYFPKKHGKKK